MNTERFRLMFTGRMSGFRRLIQPGTEQMSGPPGNPDEARERQLRELQVLHAVAVAATEATNENALIERATTIIGDMFYPDNFGILLVDAKNELLIHHPSYRAGDETPTQGPLQLDEGICGQVVRTGEPLRLDDVTESPLYLGIDPDTTSELCVPMKDGDRVIGVINTESRLASAFTVDDERLLVTLAGQLTTAIQRVRLLDSERRRWQEAEAIRSATSGITSSLELNKVLDQILMYLDEVVPFESACLFLVEENKLKCVACRKFDDPENVINHSYPVDDDPLFQEIKSSKSTLIIDDVSNDPRFKKWGNTDYVRGWMGVPLRIRGRVIGLLTLDNSRKAAYTEDEASLAQALANQAAVAIDNAKLFEESQRQALELTGLYEASLTISSVLVSEALLARLAEQVNRYFSPDSFGLFLYLEASDEIEIRMAIEEGREIPGLVGSQIPVDDSGLTGWVIRSRESLLINDLSRDDMPAEPRHLTSKARAWFGVPLIARDRLLGVISLQSFEADNYSQSDVRLLQSLAAQVATALENVRLYEAARRGFERQEALNAVISTAASETNLRNILNIALERTMRSMNVRSGGIWVGDEEINRELPAHFINKLQETSASSGIGLKYLTDTILVKDWGSIKRGNPVYPFAKWFLMMGIRSSLLVPIKADGQTTGGLYLFPTGRLQWTAEDISFVETVVKQLGGAIERLSLFNQAETNAITLATLYEAGREISTTIELDTLLELICRRATQLTAAQRSLLLLVSRDEEELVSSASLGFEDPILDEQSVQEALEGIGSWVINNRTPAIVESLFEDEPSGQSPGSGSAWSAQAGSHAMALPLNTADRTLGALILLRNPRRKNFQTDDLDLLLMLIGQASTTLANASLFDEIRNQALYQSALLALSSELATTLDVDEICERVVNSLQKLLGYENVAIFLVDEQSGERVLKSSIGLFDAPEGWRIQRGIGISELPLLDGKMHYTPDVTDNPSYVPGLPSGAEIDIPIRIDGTGVGVLIAQKLQPHSFNEDDFRILQAAASQTGTAIARAQLLETERRRAAEIEALRQASIQVTSTLELKPVLDTILEQMLSLLPADDVHIFLYEDEVLSFGAARSKDAILDNALYMPRPDGLSHLIARQGEPTFISDTATHPIDNYPKRSGAVAGLPLVIGQEVRGVMNLAFNQPHEFSESEIQILELLADQAAIALNNARTYQFARRATENAEERLEEMSAIAEVSAAMRGAGTVEEISQTLATEAARLVRAEAVVLYVHDETQGQLVAFGIAENSNGNELADEPGFSLSEKTREFVVFTWDLLEKFSHGVCLPLQTTTGKALGILVASRTSGSPPGVDGFLSDEERLLQTLAEIGANALQRARTHEELEGAYLQTVLALARAMDARDTYTNNHSHSLALLTEAVARELEIGEEKIQRFRWAALLHDIGKIGVPDHILQKPGPLNDEEWEVMKRHPEIGAEIVAPVAKLADVAPLIRAHQEKYDGTGYPDGLAGDEIPLGARILAVVDAYSAITDNRVYRSARPKEEAMVELERCAGTQFDPDVVHAFLAVLQRDG